MTYYLFVTVHSNSRQCAVVFHRYLTSSDLLPGLELNSNTVIMWTGIQRSFQFYPCTSNSYLHIGVVRPSSSWPHTLSFCRCCWWWCFVLYFLLGYLFSSSLGSCSQVVLGDANLLSSQVKDSRYILPSIIQNSPLISAPELVLQTGTVQFCEQQEQLELSGPVPRAMKTSPFFI